MNNAIINGTGSYLPERTVTNKELEDSLETTDEWIVSRTGISERHIAQSFETTSYMAAKAAENAIENSTVTADEIDLIIVATCTPDHFFPSMAAFVQEALKIKRPIPAFDISVACSGFVYAMDVAKQYIASGGAKNILVIGSETMSKAVNWEERSVCILFGDGAGAVVLSADNNSRGILGSLIHSRFDNNLLSYENPAYLGKDTKVQMRGNEVFKIAVNIMTDIVDQVLEVSNLQKKDIKWLIPHQANIRIIQAIAKKLDLPMSQVIITINNQGNTSAASIPLALDHGIRKGQVERGDLILIESFGGGMAWGAMVIEY